MAGMFAPGIIGLAMAALILLGVGDSPQAAGYLPVENVEEKKSDSGDTRTEGGKNVTEEKKESLIDLLVNDCLKNPFVVGLALTYFFVYVVRQGVTSWFVFYLLQVSFVYLHQTFEGFIED